ncbi:MAG: hypothetical protein QXL01_00150 [Thermoplasmatales archaeon]
MLDKALTIFIERIQSLGIQYHGVIYLEEPPSTQIDNSFSVTITRASGDRKNAADFSILAEILVEYYVVNYSSDIERMKGALSNVEAIIRDLCSIDLSDEIIKRVNFISFDVSYLQGSERVHKIDLLFEVMVKMLIK